MMHAASSGSPVGSEIFAGFALLVLSLLVLLILRYYLPLRTTPAYLLVPVFFALWLPAGIVLLVPIDLASRARTDDVAQRGIWFPERQLLVSWRITYWLTFALTWYVALFAPGTQKQIVTPDLGSSSLSSPSTPTPATENQKTKYSTPYEATCNTTLWSSAPVF